MVLSEPLGGAMAPLAPPGSAFGGTVGIFKIKWPKFEEKLEFENRFVLVVAPCLPQLEN